MRVNQIEKRRSEVNIGSESDAVPPRPATKFSRKKSGSGNTALTLAIDGAGNCTLPSSLSTVKTTHVVNICASASALCDGKPIAKICLFSSISVHDTTP